MSKTKWYAKALYLVFALALVVVALPAAAAENGGDAVNTLRVYGRCTENAAFPYTTAAGPFDLTSSEAPPKDFIVWNPAYMYHLDSESNGIYGDFFQSIVVNGNDANEKVHLRQWYVPKYEEPSGEVWTEQEKVASPDIVKEYTYMLLDTNNNPIAGNQGETSFVFPIADNSAQIGLDDYDVNGDGEAEKVNLNTVSDVDGLPLTADEWIDISTDMLTVTTGDVLSFLDHRAVITSVSASSITVDIYYSGNQSDSSKKSVIIPVLSTASAGRHLVHVEALTNSPPLPPSQSTEFPGTSSLQLVTEPWYLQLMNISGSNAQIIVGRLLKNGESFFVDGAEYEIAAIYAPNPGKLENPPLKYITIRNSLPKYDDITLEALTIIKKAVQEGETLPLLPPFNMEHDMIDDTNIPECIAGDPNDSSEADVQNKDNVVSEVDLYDTPTMPTPASPQISGSPDGYGDESGLDINYNTIAERRVTDVPAIVEYFIAEDKEERFDTNLLEEKVSENVTANVTAEDWRWINIETLPWDYTEFVLPELEDATSMSNDDGDYILVSSWVTEDEVRVKFVYDAAVGIVNSADIYVNDYTNYNSLRVYGRCTENAAFPYTTAAGPFDLTSSEAPPKDFIVWNPAYMYHLDSESNGIYGDFFQSIVVNGNDANEKVHLRQWYVPKYEEPSGEVWTEQEKVASPDIVKEYTYMLLDTNNNPIAGNQGETSFVFPIADNSAQIGLDDYDVNGDGEAEKVNLNTVSDVDGLPLTADEWIDISTDMLTVTTGDVLSFLDHRAVITSVSASSITVDIYYSGNQSDSSKKSVIIPVLSTASAGRHLVHVEALTNSPPLPPSQSTEFPGTSSLQLVTEPWYLQLMNISGSNAQIIVGRLLKNGESFFVDGAEYEIAAIYAPNPGKLENPPLKYITIRNSLPKYDDITLEALTIIKKAVQEGETLPLLPPFNMEHDMIDDTNIPECIAGDPNDSSEADVQNKDNVVSEVDLYDTPTMPTPASPQISGSPDGYGDESGLDINYNTIAERRVTDVPAIVEYFIAEDKEERFDTNLLEEKVSENVTANVTAEDWRWINIETLPWDYTEFVLPELPDTTDPVNNDDGDYILVSSFLTEDSGCFLGPRGGQGELTNGSPVRVKFVYDAVDGTGLYVNTIPIGPVDHPTICRSPTTLGFSANVGGDNPASKTFNIWNCGDAGTTLGWSVSDGAAWLSESPPSGSSTGEDDTVTVSVDITGLSEGIYPATITITAPGATNTPQTVAVTLTVTEYPRWDVNQDGHVNVLDMVLVGQHWGETGTPGWIPEDVNEDGVINVLDMVLIGQHWTG